MEQLTSIATFEEYQREALKTASAGKGRVVEGLVRVCGLVGEAAELREACGSTPFKLSNIEKELGDVLWYAAALSEWLGLGVQFAFEAIQDIAARQVYEDGPTALVLFRAGKLAEIMKKHLGHDKPMDDFKGAELELMQGIFLAIAHVANIVGLDLDKVAAANINKLRARYQGGGFTSTLANAHVDEMIEDIRAVADARERAADETPKCTGTLVHSEFESCPKHDS